MKEIEIKTISELRTTILKSFNDDDYKKAQMKPIDKTITGTGFFPVGDGLFREKGFNPKLPLNGIMVVGQDFDNEKNYTCLVENYDSEIKKGNKTFSNLTKNYNIFNKDTDYGRNNLMRTFFTNALLGVREGEMSNKGLNAAFKKSPIYIEKCRRAFICQLRVLKPRIIIFMGSALIKFVSSDIISKELKDRIKGQTISKLIYYKIHDFTYSNGKPVVVAFIIHPCLSTSNIWRKEYKNLAGNQFKEKPAEEAMLEDAMKGLF
jgi:hypothetical protein